MLKNGNVLAYWTQTEFTVGGVWTHKPNKLYTIRVIDAKNSSYVMIGQCFRENIYHEYSKVVENAVLLKTGSKLRLQDGRKVSFVGASENGEHVFFKTRKGTVVDLEMACADNVAALL
jgi:hypothetical protein